MTDAQLLLLFFAIGLFALAGLIAASLMIDANRRRNLNQTRHPFKGL